MKTTISPVTLQPNVVQPSAAQHSTTQPVVAAQPTVADDCLNHLEGSVGTSVYTKVDVENQFGPFNLPAKANLIAAASLSTSTINPVVFDATANQEQLPRCREQPHRGSRVANPDITPISDSVVELLLSEQDRAQIVREIQRLEKRIIIAQVLGIRPRRADLRLLLQASLKQDIDNITDIQMLGRNYYQVEFELERMVPILLEKKTVAIKGGWVFFHKWSHNFSANQVLHDLDSYHTCVAVFPNLRKEWVPFVHLIAGTIGTVLETYDKPRQNDDKYMGATSTKLLISKSTNLPSNILLPNLLDSRQESYSQRILYRGLPNQCFRCFGFGHLAKNCPKFNKDTDKHVPNTTIVPAQVRSEGWTEVGHRKVSSQVSYDKRHQVSINNLKEFPPLQNRYSTLQVEEDRSHEVNISGQSLTHFSQKTDLLSTKLPETFPKLVVGQPPLKIVENQLLTPNGNLDSSEKLKGKVVSAQDNTDVEMPPSVMGFEANQQIDIDVHGSSVPFDKLVGKSTSSQSNMMGVEMAQGVDKLPCAGYQFTVSQDTLTLQTPQKQVKDHRVHKHAGNYLLLKRQARAQEGAQKGRQDALLEKRTSIKSV